MVEPSGMITLASPAGAGELLLWTVAAATLAGAAVSAVVARFIARKLNGATSSRTSDAAASELSVAIEEIDRRLQSEIGELRRQVAEVLGASQPLIERDEALASMPPRAVEENAGEARSERTLAEDVLRLSRQGFTPLEIARRLDETTGKVELVLAIHRLPGA